MEKGKIIQSMTPTEVISCLWNKNATEKCKVGLADTIVFERGIPISWYVTGKTGEVTRKRSMDLEMISQRFFKIASQSSSNIVAILRQENGIIKLLPFGAWQAFISQFVPDKSIISLHAYVKGNNNAIYRNKYRLKDRQGRVATSTHSYSMKFNQSDPESISIMNESEITLAECRSNQICNVLDLASSTVVRYLEMMMKMRITSLTIDYAIDLKSQIWILWVADTRYTVSFDQLTNEDFGLHPSAAKIVHDRQGRMSWAGLKYFETMVEEAEKPAVDFGSTSLSPSRTMTVSPPKTAQKQPSDPSVASMQLNTAVSVNKSSGDNKRDRSSRTIHDSATYNIAVGAAQGATQRAVTPTALMSNYPQPFKCKGDYCTLHIHPVDAALTVGIPHAADHIVEKLFTKSELTKLRKDKQFGQMMSFGTPGPALAAISMKNIILARQERRGLTANTESSGSFNVYPSSPRSKMTFKEQVELSMKASLDGGQRVITGEDEDQKLKESILAHDKQVRETFTKSMASYYDQVRVCGVCYNVYNCLDWAREVLGQGDAYGAGLEGKGAQLSASGSRRTASRRQLDASKDGTVSISDSVSENSSITEATDLKSQSLNSLQSLKRNLVSSNNAVTSALNKPRLGVTSTPLSKSQPVPIGRDSPPKHLASSRSKLIRSRRSRAGQASPPKDDHENVISSPDESSATLQSASVAPSRATWKDRVTSRSKLEAEQKKNSRTMHVDFEEKKPVDGAKFVALDDYLRSGADIVAVKKLRQRQNDDDRSVVSGDVYRGRVLFACEDNEFAKAALAVLEEAFFAVHWVKDGRQALNDFVLSDNTISSNGIDKNKSNSSDIVSGNSSVANTVLNSVISTNIADSGFDCVLVQRDLPLCDAFKVTSGIREFEKNQRKQAAAIAAMAGKGITPPTRRHAVICYTSSTSPEDLKLYMKADMDGCVSHPVNRASLLNTVRAAIPHHLAPIAPDQLSLAESYNSPSLSAASSGPKVYRLGSVGEMEGSKDSSSTAAKSLPLRTGAGAEEDCAFHGVVQLDADTRLPFTVLDSSRSTKGGNFLGNGKRPFFNLVVCHDIFDTSEKLKIFLRPMVQRYIGMQVLLWNYPGQAFTEWRKEQLLNNEYLAGCLNDLLGQVGERGTRDFDTSRPFYILGYGLGASVGGFYASHYRVPSLRGILSVNGWSFLDSYLAGVMHDCINVFQCAPPTRPDLPVYFFSRFLFSKEYLAKVSVPLALNIYTAIHNAISLEGRLGLCRGVLQTVDLRPVLREIDCPLICIHSTQDALSRPLHAEPFVTSRGGEVRSIFKALQNPAKTCVIWVKAGHEIFQESKKQTQLLVEQILTGFHETHDVSFPAAPAVDPTGAAQGRLVTENPWSDEPKKEKTVEDKFIDNVLNSMNRISGTAGSASADKLATSKSTGVLPPINHSHSSTANRPRTTSLSPNHHHGDNSSVGSLNSSIGMQSPGASSVHFSATDPGAWTQYSQLMVDSQHAAQNSTEKRGKLKSRKSRGDESTVDRVIDPTSAMFEKQDKATYKAGAGQAVHDYPEVKEYMSWRLKRNKKRLQRLQAAAKSIQGAFRAHLARKFVHNIRRYKAALLIQRIFRGWLGRCDFIRRTRYQWASQIIQKYYRGYRARKWYFLVRLHIAAASNIQRMVRAMLARKRVARIQKRRYTAASTIQALLRRFKARRDVWRIRRQTHCATQVQRVFRGHLGRIKAAAERDKFIFSRSQSQGIEFGRQMLLEHKLHATRLQSDVTLLTQEKIAAEEQVEALLEEISSFEDGVRVLEKEMHQLSKVEAEAAAFMDADSRFELREQKIKLDREFGEMLGKIGNRKELLSDLERKLGTVDKARQGKEEELRTLERKLVVLLEEQQNELNAIKRKQDVRGALLAASHKELVKATASSSGASTSGSSQVTVAQGGGGGGGPSLQEKKQAAQLMQSTETLMKFGFMSMSMTYFSSLNMIKALRTVSAQDTVMAALADVHSQRAVGFQPDSSAAPAAGMAKPPFLPNLKKGQLSGQEALRVSAWSVDDVAKWLQTLSLGQYSEAFNDAAIDGEFLFDINDDDLKNTLGIEHRLHRKKILNCVHRLKLAEAQKDSRLNDLLRESNGLEPPTLAPDVDESQNFPKNPFKPNEGGKGGPGESAEDRLIDGPKIPLTELFSLVRHSKFSLLKDALDYLPSKPFDKSLIQAQYAVDHGTIYLPGYERLPFHLNKTDDFGNSLLSYACQNGNAKICKYLIAKGANMNHQNAAGQTPAHFAIAFKFFDLSTWMFENGADDTIHNKFGLSPYDGLLAEGGDELLSLET